MSTGRRLRELLHTKAPLLGPLVAHSQHIARVERLLHQHLGAELAPRCRVANLRQGVLVIQIDSPAWATRLRYQLPALKEALAQLPDLRPITTIRLRIAAEVFPSASAPRPPAALPAAAATALRQTAECIGDPALKAALLRLARRRRPSRG